MATPMLTEEQTRGVLNELESATVAADLHLHAFHWLSVLIGKIKKNDINKESLLELAHYLADEWCERARADSEGYDRTVAEVEHAGSQRAQA